MKGEILSKGWLFLKIEEIIKKNTGKVNLQVVSERSYDPANYNLNTYVLMRWENTGDWSLYHKDNSGSMNELSYESVPNLASTLRKFSESSYQSKNGLLFYQKVAFELRNLQLFEQYHEIGISKDLEFFEHELIEQVKKLLEKQKWSLEEFLVIEIAFRFLRAFFSGSLGSSGSGEVHLRGKDSWSAPTRLENVSSLMNRAIEAYDWHLKELNGVQDKLLPVLNWIESAEQKNIEVTYEFWELLVPLVCSHFGIDFEFEQALCITSVEDMEELSKRLGKSARRIAEECYEGKGKAYCWRSTYQIKTRISAVTLSSIEEFLNNEKLIDLYPIEDLVRLSTDSLEILRRSDIEPSADPKNLGRCELIKLMPSLYEKIRGIEEFIRLSPGKKLSRDDLMVLSNEDSLARSVSSGSCAKEEILLNRHAIKLNYVGGSKNLHESKWKYIFENEKTNGLAKKARAQKTNGNKVLYRQTDLHNWLIEKGYFSIQQLNKMIKAPANSYLKTWDNCK